MKNLKIRSVVVFENSRRLSLGGSCRRICLEGAAALIISLAFVATDVQAAEVRFLFTGTGSGALGDVPFTDRNFSVRISGDTDDIQAFESHVLFIDGLNGTIDIDGLGVSTFDAPLYVFRNNDCVCLGFGNEIQFDLIDVDETGLGIETWDMTTSFGPIFTSTPFFAQFSNVQMDTGFLKFTAMSDVTFTARVGPPMTVAIDIKPGSFPNSVNLGSNGVVPVAILSSPDFDATMVDESTVELAGALVAIRGKNHFLASEEDVNGDGLLDLVCQVDTVNFDPGTFQDGFAVLTGRTFDVSYIEGLDEITIVPQN